MSQDMEPLAWSAKAEPLSPFTVDDNYWLLSDDLVSNDGIFISLPLSLIQEEKKVIDECKHIDDISIDQDDFNFQFVPSVKNEDPSESPPYSPSNTSEDDYPMDKISRAEFASKLLNDLDEQKEEPLCDFFEAKIDLPIFEEISPPKEIHDTQSLLLEFDSICGAVGINGTHLPNLTPPQSPQDILSIPPQTYNSPVIDHYVWDSSLYAEPVTNNVDIDKELAAVDDLVLHTAENIIWEGKDFSSLPQVEILSSSMENEICITVPNENALSFKSVEHKNASHFYNESSYVNVPSDPVYFMSSEESSSPSPSSPSSSCSTYGSSENDDEWSYPSPVTKNGNTKNSRPKPYSRSTDDKKSRKKEQNKNAATRYRQKKKAEIEVLMEEEKILQNQNEDLNKQYTDIRREVSYLKGLMRDLFKAKGLL